MSRTIKHTARKIATFEALRDWRHRHDGITHSDRSLGVSEPAGRWRAIWIGAYKVQFSGRRRRRLYAEARKAKATAAAIDAGHDNDIEAYRIFCSVFA